MILQEDKPISEVHDLIVGKIRKYFNDCGCKDAVIGLSGGIDSAVVYALASEALGKDHVMGILMPSQFSSMHSISDAVDLANNVGGKFEIIPIEKIYAVYMIEMKRFFPTSEWSVALENLQARIRGNILMTYSNKACALLLNTSNKSELCMGYGTMYGDLCGAMMVIADLYKVQVYELAKYINRNGEVIPISSIEKAPSAELRKDQKDSDTLPAYEILDPVLHSLVEEGLDAEEVIKKGADRQLVERIVSLKRKSAFKIAQIPPVITVGDAPLVPEFKRI